MTTRQAAIIELLALEDPPELVGRGHTLTVDGDPNRRWQARPKIMVRWLMTRDLMVDGDFDQRRAKKTWLHLMKRSA